MSLEDEDDEMGSMSLTELLLKELEAEVLKPQHFEYDDDDSGDVREARTPPPVFKNWQAALMKSQHSRLTSESESAPSFGDVLDTVVSSADDQETFTSIINKCALEGLSSNPTSSPSTCNIPNAQSGSAANNMMHPNFRFARPPQGSMMGPPTRPMMNRPGFNMNGPLPGQMMNRPHGPMMNGPHGPMMNGPHGPMMNGPHGLVMNGARGPMNGPPGPMNGPPGPMNRPPVHMNGPPGHMNGPPGHMNGPRGPMNGPMGSMNGPRGPMNRPHGPINGPHGPINGPHSPMNGPHSPMNGLHSPMNGPHGLMNGPRGPMNGPPPGPLNGPPPGPLNGPPPGLINGSPLGPMKGPPPGLMNGPPPSPMNGPPPSPMNLPPLGPMNVPPPSPMNGPPGPMHFPGHMNMMYDMSYNMMNNGMHGYPVPNVFSNPSYANLPISVASIPDTTLSTQLKSIKKKRVRKDINETTSSNISGDASVSTTAPLPSKSLPSPPSEMSFIPPAPLPDYAPPTPRKTPALRHVKEHKIVMKLEKRTMKEPPQSGITSRAKKTIIADYGSSSDDEKDKPESHRKKALHHSITSVRLGENEALPDLYSKLRKLNEELAMLQQDEGSRTSSSDTSSDDDEVDSTNNMKADASTTKLDGKPLTPLPSVTPSTISPIRPNLDARIKMMMDDKNTPPVKKPPGPEALVAFRRPMPPRQVARPPKNASNARVSIPSAVETSMLKPLARPPSPFLSTEIYHYWHKESIKFCKYRKKSHVPYVDPKGRHNFHKGRFVHIQSKPLRSQAALDIYSLLDKKLKDDSNLNTVSTRKKALLTEEIERDMKRLEAINRELKILEEEEEKNKSINTEECDKEPSADLRQLEELNKKWRELQNENNNCLPFSDGGSDDDEDLKRLEELNRELRKLEEEEEDNIDETDDADKQEPEMSVTGGSNLIKKIIPNLADNLEPELVESVGLDLKRLEEINKALEEMETDGPDESAAVDRPDECYGKVSNIPSINCLQESLAFQRARDMSGDAIGPIEPADEEPNTNRSQKRPVDQELISLVMNSVMEELKKDLRNSIASNLVNDKMLEYGQVPMKKQKTSVA